MVELEETLVVVLVYLILGKKYLVLNGDIDVGVGQQILGVLCYVRFVATLALILKPVIAQLKALKRNSYFKTRFSRKKIQSLSFFWFSMAHFSSCFVTISLALKFRGDGKYGDYVHVGICLLFLNICFYLFFTEYDLKNSWFVQTPSPLVKTIGNTFMLVLALIIERFEENNICDIMLNFSSGLLIFCTVQKIGAVTDFGLFNLFIIKSVEITFKFAGLDSLGAWFFLCCVLS